ncbi:MAG TPA: hypothetical protein VKE69_07215 [Planctomycetota bacterium]|nr:hypothetical protein [Planctomycetota bacterium]
MDAHLEKLKKRARRGDEYKSIGSELFAELSLLDAHFGLGDVVRKDWRSRFPDSPSWEGTFKEFETLGRASYFIRRNFTQVHVSDLRARCESPCPKSASGAEWAGSAHPGSLEFTIYMQCFDKQSEDAKTAIVLHEAFHASFDAFSGDSYSSEPGYPGTVPVSNADSYATFASVVATGSSYRVIQVPGVTITSGP